VARDLAILGARFDSVGPPGNGGLTKAAFECGLFSAQQRPITACVGFADQCSTVVTCEEDKSIVTQSFIPTDYVQNSAHSLIYLDERIAVSGLFHASTNKRGRSKGRCVQRVWRPVQEKRPAF